MTEVTYQYRHRINISTSVKGVVTPDITVEVIDGSAEYCLQEAKDLYLKAQALCTEVQAADAG